VHKAASALWSENGRSKVLGNLLCVSMWARRVLWGDFRRLHLHCPSRRSDWYKHTAIRRLCVAAM